MVVVRLVNTHELGGSAVVVLGGKHSVFLLHYRLLDAVETRGHCLLRLGGMFAALGLGSEVAVLLGVSLVAGCLAFLRFGLLAYGLDGLGVWVHPWVLDFGGLDLVGLVGVLKN